jgi:hypothetical protein
LSYPATGSDGDGLRFAGQLGHTVNPCSPSLVPLDTLEDFIPRLMGLSLKNIRLTIRTEKKVLYSENGEMMFTHCGITGPLVLTGSALIGRYLKEGPLKAEIDLKPALTPEKLDERLLREFTAFPNRQFKNVIGSLFPSSLTPVMTDLSGINPETPCHSITASQRQAFGKLIKHLTFTVTGTAGFREAIITRGGVHVREVNPRTMESKLVKGLYFAGEILDVDALTGGFNLQIAWSTAHLAAQAILNNLENKDF